MDHQPNIKNCEQLTLIFGCWPSFHDAEVIWFRLDRRATTLGDGPTVETLIHVFEMTNEVDKNGYYVLQNHVLVNLRFSRVMQPILSDFNHQNVLHGLGIEDIRQRQLESLNFIVSFGSSFGLEASFQCEAVEVVGVERCDGDDDLLRQSHRPVCGKPQIAPTLWKSQ